MLVWKKASNGEVQRVQLYVKTRRTAYRFMWLEKIIKVVFNRKS